MDGREREDLAINVGQNVKALRERANLTQGAVAQYLGVKQNLISMCESGERKFSLVALEKLADLFGCSAASLIQNEVPNKTLDYAFRADDIQGIDLDAVATINRIAMNLMEMQRLWSDGQEFAGN